MGDTEGLLLRPAIEEFTSDQSRPSGVKRPLVLKQDPATIWLTGLSGSGKTSLALQLEQELTDRGYLCVVLDGDCVRHGLNKDLGFTPADRAENIRRVAEVARLFNGAGLIVIAAFISPYAKDREAARKIIGEAQFLEIYLAADLATCEARDPRGLYLKARGGQIADFTGVSAPYEVPENPALSLDTASRPIDECVQKMMGMLCPRLR